MTHFKLDAVVAAVRNLRCALGGASADESQWANNIHAALGQLTAAIQEEIQTTDKSKASLGAINPDFQDAPTTERHVQSVRAHFIELSEKTHQLRADLHEGPTRACLDVKRFRHRCEEICAEVEKVRQTMGEFLLQTINSNPGAGD